jgi:hypothetical protein
MAYQEGNLRRILLWRIASVLFISLLITATALAQRPAGAGPPPVNSPKLENADRDARQGALRGAEIDATRDRQNKERLEAGIVQVKQDFTHLQVVRNQIAHNLVAKKPHDFTLISDQTKDINKVANRLKAFMMARATENKDQEKDANAPSEFNGEDMTGALVKLCKTIDSFVENPALKNAVDAQQLDKIKDDKARADADLLTIIQLSDKIQKSADNLKQSPK